MESQHRKPVIVLVHGAWQTAATWDLAVPRLRASGCDVHTPRLTGMEGEPSELTAGVTLDTHIADVVRHLETADLRDVILVGHSYAGMIFSVWTRQSRRWRR